MKSENENTADLVIAMVDHVDTRFERYGYVLPAHEALQSQDVTRSLLKMALFSLNMHSMVFPGETPEKTDVVAVPDILVGAAMHYVMQVAPFAGDRGENGKTAHVDDLLEHVAKIEAGFGEIAVDQEIVDMICSRIDMRPRPEGPGREPERQGSQ